MELKIKPYHKNLFSTEGILIKHHSAKMWFQEIYKLQLTLDNIKLFVVPNTTPNSVWGCFIIPNQKLATSDFGKHQICQKISQYLYIPEKSILFPPITVAETDSLFHSNIHIIHPEFGLVELTEELDVRALISEPKMKSYYVSKPVASIFIPKEIKQFQVMAVSNEEVIKNMEENIFPKKEEMKDDSLSIIEKGKLGLYKLFFKTTKSGGSSGLPSTEKTGLWAKLESLINFITPNQPKWVEKMQHDYEDLEKRNQKQIDKLMDLFKNNLDEALKYAIPLDENGSVRGGTQVKLELTKRWFDFSLSASHSSNGVGSIDLGDNLQVLRNQYNQTAQNLINERQFHKAAFIYMKLLKDYHMAALTLEKGEFYQEAATIYLKHCYNKQQAALCYEKGNMTYEAITIYKELNQNEKVGDLYLIINKRKDADFYFEKVVDEYKTRNQYVKASLIYKNKINNAQRGQGLLLEGWRNNKDASNCLNNYFVNIPDTKQLKLEIETIYTNDLNRENSVSFLQVIHHEYKKKNEISEYIKEVAYEVIASQIPTNPSIVSELKNFNTNDKELQKDTMRFKINRK